MTTQCFRWLGKITLIGLTSFAFASSATAQIPHVSVLTTDPHAAEEGSDPGSFTLLRTGPIGEPLTVHYTVGGTAQNGVDCLPLTGNATFPPDCSCIPINVHPIDDALVEGNESVVVALVQPASWPPPYFVTWPSAAFLVIEDNDRSAVNQPPHVAIVNPPDEAVFVSPVDLILTARATDSDGRVVSVEFFDGETSLGVVLNRPFIATPRPSEKSLDLESDRLPELVPNLDFDIEAHPADDLISILPGSLFRLRWPDVSPGAHTLTALATDNRGATTTSTPIRIRVTEPPQQPVVTIRASDPVATEPGALADRLDTAVFTLHRTGGTDFPMNVLYRVDGTAENGADYHELPSVATIPVGSRTVELVIAPLPDNRVEGTEHVRIQILPPVCIAIFPPPPDCYLVGRHDAARAVILDNTTEPNLPPAVRLVRPLDGDVFRAPADLTLAALAHDRDGEVRTVEFFAGDRSLGIVTNDSVVATADRPHFVLDWNEVPPGHYILTAEATDNNGATTVSRPVEIKVIESTLPPVVTIEATDPRATEGPIGIGSDDPAFKEAPPIKELGEFEDSGATLLDIAIFTVSRTGPTDLPLTVYYELAGTAENGVDYATLSGEATIPAGARSGRIIVAPLDDNLPEPTESVVVELVPIHCFGNTPFAPDGCYVVGHPNRAEAFIVDNDTPGNRLPRIDIVTPENESVFTAPAEIEIIAVARDPDGWVGLVEFFEGNTKIGEVAVNFLVPPPPGQQQRFEILWNAVPSGGYSLTAKATDDRGGIGLSDPVEIKVVNPNHIPVVTVRSPDAFASEPDPAGPELDTATFTLHRSSRISFPLTVKYALRGTAENGLDYEWLPGEAAIPANAHSVDVFVRPLDDDLIEGTEQVVIRLLDSGCGPVDPPPVDCYVVGPQYSSIAYILDNDVEPNRPPHVRITSPEEGALFQAPVDIRIVANARDSDGWVATVEFFAGDLSLGMVTNRPLILDPFPLADANTLLFREIITINPFHLAWEDVPLGDHVLTAVATDNDGASTRSEPVKITVDEPPLQPIVTIKATDPIASEGSIGSDETSETSNTATFTITRRGGEIDKPLSVFFRIGGSASNGQDYREIPHNVIIPADARSTDILIAPIDDNQSEGTEDVVLSLVPPICIAIDPPPPDCYLLGRNRTATALILDNDGDPNRPPVASILSPADGETFMTGTDIRIVAEAKDFDGNVDYVEFFEGENSLGIVRNPLLVPDPIPFDPVPLPGDPIMINASSDALTKVTVLDALIDPIIRPPFPLYALTWPDVPPGRFVLTAVAVDDDGEKGVSRPVEIKVTPRVRPPVVSIEATDPSASEIDPRLDIPEDPAVFTLTRTGPTDHALTVFYRIAGSAENGVDYDLLPNRMTIPAGAASTEIHVSVIDDTRCEGVESVVLWLTDGSSTTNFPPPRVGYRVGRPAHARAAILDDEICPPNQPPLVEIIRPEDGTLFHGPTDIGIWARARDRNGRVVAVEFFEGDTSLGTTQAGSTDPDDLFLFKWENVPAGEYVLTAVATDNDGVSTKSESIGIRVFERFDRQVVNIVARDPFATEGGIPIGPPGSLGPVIDKSAPILHDPAVFVVTRSGNVNLDLMVFYSLGGTAGNGDDYTTLSGEILIPAGERSAQIIVDPIDDDLVEGVESVIATLLPPPCLPILPTPVGCYLVGHQSEASAFIRDNDVQHNLAPHVEIVSPASGSAFDAPADIEITAHTSDPDGWVTQVQFFEGNRPIGGIAILVTEPPPHGELQTFSFTWQDVPPGSYVLTVEVTDNRGSVGVSEPVKVDVVDGHVIPVVTIHATDPWATEGRPRLDPAPQPPNSIFLDPASFTVRRTGRLDRPLLVSYEIRGAAQNGVDYRELSGEALIPAWEDSVLVFVVPFDDLLVEGTEEVSLLLVPTDCVTSEPRPEGCYIVGRPNQATAFILDNDFVPNRPPFVSIVDPQQGDVFTAPAHIRVVVHALDPDGWVGNVALYEGDNLIDEQSIVFIVAPPPGQLQIFDFNWNNVPPGRYVLTAKATDQIGAMTWSRRIEITVGDPNQPPVVTLMSPDPYATEDEGNEASFRVRRNGPTTAALTVHYAISGTAVNGVDYNTIPNSVTIPAGRRTARIRVEPIDDNRPEDVETVILQLTLPATPTPAPYSIGIPDAAAAVIVDNDQLRPPCRRLAGGLFHICLPAENGFSFRIEASNDLFDWKPIGNNTVTDGALHFVDPNATQHSIRFYRVAQEVDFGLIEEAEELR